MKNYQVFRTITVIAALLLSVGSSHASTIYVPDDYGTIQDAIDFAVNGDSVVARPGTYVENIYFLGKAISVSSEMGASVTTIDGNQNGSVGSFTSGEDATSIIEGFTLTNGSGSPIG